VVSIERSSFHIEPLVLSLHFKGACSFYCKKTVSVAEAKICDLSILMGRRCKELIAMSQFCLAAILLIVGVSFLLQLEQII
jgi:hypothetical protein